MGKHRGNSSSEQPIRARTIAVRCISGGFCLSLAVLTFGVQGLAGSVTTQVAPNTAAVSGAVAPLPLSAAIPAGPAAASNAAEAPVAFTADPSALVGFSRSTVETSSGQGGGGELNVASASLKRPAPGWLMAPLESLRETSPYGLRTSPLTGHSGEFHWGQDYAAACGTRVYSADAGVVRAVGWHPWGGGNRVEIDHGNGLITTYNHLEAIAVKKGDSVRVGEVIARVGTTGSSTGCHLHFETILNGSHTDPHGWKMLPTTQVDPLGTIEMTSYEPEANRSSNASIGWAIPVREDLTHEVTGGVQEKPVPAVVATPGATPTPSAKPTAPPATKTPAAPPATKTPAAKPTTPTAPAAKPTAPPTTPTTPAAPAAPPAKPTTPTAPPKTPTTPAAPPKTPTTPAAPPKTPTTPAAPPTAPTPKSTPSPSSTVASTPAAPTTGVTQPKKSAAVTTTPRAPAGGTATSSAAVTEPAPATAPTSTPKR
ncbi:M23 family metallopeptidase [Arthrobacter sp. UYEF20]|uniref:M23 family metallopeptidase n=1 Tax=Arthrobacter sp. UYEF20 TaxID=1756363 RepID=UPI0033931C42